MKRRALSLITALALCLSLCPVRVWAADGETGGESCPHHTEHTEECGYAAEDPGEPCTFVCRICPIEARIGALPASVSEDNWEQVQAQIEEIYDLCGGLTSEELQQVDLSACLALLEQIEGMEAEAQSTASGHSGAEDTGWTLENDHTFAAPYVVSKRYNINTSEYTLIGTGEAVIQVSGTGVLDFKGAIKSQKGVGVEVLSGGVLRISEQVNIRGQSYALSVASGGEAHLSAGTYFGKQSAIWVEDGDYTALLEEGYAYFDENGDPIQPEDLANALTVVVQQCTEHNKTYTHNENAPTHTWSCSACQLKETEKCTFTFLQDGTGKCDFCGRTIAIVVDEDALSNLVYDGKLKPEQVGVTVTLDSSGKELVRDTDYEVDIQSIKDAGQATVTVTGITFNGTFVRTYTVSQDKPTLEWDTVTKPAPITVNYDGEPVEKSDLPQVKINIQSTTDNLQGYLQYFYKEPNDSDYIDGLPTNAGTYNVIVKLPELPNFEGAESAPITLTVNPINPITTPPAAAKPVYNGAVQALVTSGELAPVAVRDGLKIQFADNENGPWSTDIPTGLKAGEYTVWYQVTDLTGNYIRPNKNPEEITDVKIQRKQITPFVTLSEYTYLYDGGEHQPKVTVKDEDNVTVILDTEYEVNYTNNRNVGTATVTVIDALGGNYELTAVAVEFKITQRTQDTLSITQKPNTVTYGDKFTLGTTGGSGSGNVTWKITDGTDVAEVDPNSGQVTVTGHGSATVKATKSGASPVRTPDGNYEDAIALWTFTAGKKPVTAVLTVTDRDYMASDTTAKVTAAVPDSELVSGDSITITGLTGTFEDPNAGTDKKVTVNSSNPTVTGTNWENYDITYPAATTASIRKAEVKDVTPPTANANLEYTSLPLTLVTGGGATGGTMEYSLDGTMYSASLPTGINAGSYDVWYRVKGDSNHKDSTPAKLDDVTIAKNTGTPTVLCMPSTFQYDGTEKTPTVVVRDNAQRIIPESEYTVSFSLTPMIAVKTYTVTVTDKPGGNYEFSGDKTGTFEIVAASQNPLSIITDKPTDLYYGDTFRLTAMGGSGNGAIHWNIAESNVAIIDDNGVVTVEGTGGFTVQAYREASSGYSQSNTDSVPFVAHPKPVTPVVTAKDKPYDGTTTAELIASWKPGDLVGSDTITLTVEGQFVTADVGTGKQVTITSKTPDGASGNYSITWPASTTASISKVDAKLATAPVGNNLTYTGEEQELVTGGTTVGGIGTIEYSLSQNGQYSTTIPTGKDAGKYTVWYRVAESVNYTGISAAAIEVEIKKAVPTISTNPTATGTEGQSLSEIELSDGGATDVSGTFAWKDGSIKPDVGTSSQTVVFTPDDTANYTTVEFQIDVTIQAASGTGSGSDGSGSSTETSGPSTTVQDGTASTVLSASDGSSLVREAAASQSDRVVIKPEVTGDVTRTEVSIPASTVSRLQSETNAALTVSAPIADVTIPNQALDTLSSAGGTVNVATEQVDQAVVLTLTAGGEKVEELPGGLTLSVPVEDAGPGTVAVLVHEDGTRETIRKSVVEDGMVNIPLNGSATVEIVDNSKEFADVPSTNWAADAVAFASAHELFSGTSENTFSPNQPMSRGMLTTVLYNLEGRPEQDLTVQDLADGYSDVSSDAWYAGGIAWAAENGIASGYANGQFGPNDSITREQFAVMLWKYAGSPGSDSQLDFTDADQISGYAQTALRWAAEKGILSGYTNGQLSPKGTATRAEAAQMLKSFLENS